MLKSLVAAVVLAALSIAPALAGQQDFKIINKTGYQIDEIYVSRGTSKNWGRDVMGRDALSDDESVNITVNAPDNVCRWDIKVKYNDGDESEWSNVNLCSISTLTLFWDRKNNRTRAVSD